MNKVFPNRPFVMNVFPKFDTKKVHVSGDTSKKKLPASLPANFQIDTKEAGKADINVTIKVQRTKLISIQEELRYSLNSVVRSRFGCYRI